LQNFRLLLIVQKLCAFSKKAYQLRQEEETLIITLLICYGGLNLGALSSTEQQKKEVAMSKIFIRSKIAVFSSVLAVVLATVSATSVFAASATFPRRAIHHLAGIQGNQYRQLQADRIFYDRVKSRAAEISNSSTPAEIQQYLNQYAFALSQAEAIVRHTSSSSVSNVNARNKNSENTLQGQLAMYLHMMRGLRAKLGD
jgi:hypothetical protein